VTRAAVIGAGIAGLTAARRLAAAGLEVELLDKGRRPGGRLSTRRAESLAFDHGAQYFTCRDPDFAPIVEDWCSRGIAAPWEAPICSLTRGAVSPAGADAVRYVGVPGMSALARDLERGLSLRCQWTVASLEGTPRERRLRSAQGRTLEGFDVVLIATPAPQALPLLAPSRELAERVRRVEMQPCLAVMLRLEEPLGLDLGGAFVSDSPLRWIARNDSKPGRPPGECWVLHAAPEWSEARIAEPPESAIEPLVEALGEALGRDLPRVAFASAHRWRHALTRTPLEAPCLWDPATRLGACGDWAVGGRVEGAFLSGARLAEAVLSID
jgi:predicted NAD/FAD-dependent oxidoreductase